MRGWLRIIAQGEALSSFLTKEMKEARTVSGEVILKA